MTRCLTRLADLAYRRRGRMVLAWIAADGRDHRRRAPRWPGEYNADYNTPGSESKAASDLTEERFDGYSGQEIYVVWKDEAGADSPAAKRARRRLLRRGRAGRPHRRARRRSGSRDDGTIGATTLPLTVPGWEVKKEDGEKLIAAAEEQQRRRARDQARRRPDLRRAGGSEPRGARLPRRRDRAADRLRLGGGRRPAARDRAGRPRHHLGRPDRPARQRRRRARLDDGGVGPDRDRGRHRLRAARPDPVPRGDERRQGPPRRGGRGRHDRRAQRDHRRRAPW